MSPAPSELLTTSELRHLTARLLLHASNHPAFT